MHIARARPFEMLASSVTSNGKLDEPLLEIYTAAVGLDYEPFLIIDGEVKQGYHQLVAWRSD